MSLKPFKRPTLLEKIEARAEEKMGQIKEERKKIKNKKVEVSKTKKGK